MPEYTRALVWFRRDLRDYDYAALTHALKQAREVVCAFVFDREILNGLTDRAGRRVAFIHACVGELQQALQAGEAVWWSDTGQRATKSCNGWRNSGSRQCSRLCKRCLTLHGRTPSPESRIFE